jgi:hypothetical protein
MNWMLAFEPVPAARQVEYAHRLLLTGSCFSTNIGTLLTRGKFQAVYNPTGIVFDPLSICRHLEDYVSGRTYVPEDLVLQRELWHSWQHHSDFSGTRLEEMLEGLNGAVQQGYEWIRSCDWLFITMGTAYSYGLLPGEEPVANCHKAPRDRFVKKLLDIETITGRMSATLAKVREVNPKVKIVLTVSPVKHIRDGIVENTRSKSRLIEAMHRLTEVMDECMYFPAYELVTDVLRDYRFYAPDMAHPNEQAVGVVFDHFCKTFLSPRTQQLLGEVNQVVSAKNHRPLHEDTAAHRQFLDTFRVKTEQLQQKLPMLSWVDELQYFTT